MDAIAITGFSFKFPQGAEDEAGFWEILENGRNVMSPWPEKRANVDAFRHPGDTRAPGVRYNSPTM
jgi:acyl transferase domain-containing protein